MIDPEALSCRVCQAKAPTACYPAMPTIAGHAGIFRIAMQR